MCTIALGVLVAVLGFIVMLGAFVVTDRINAMTIVLILLGAVIITAGAWVLKYTTGAA